MNHLPGLLSLRGVMCAAALATAAGCGGGGGGGAAAPVGAAEPVVAALPTVATFSSITAPAGFDWSTAQGATAGIALARASGAELGGSVRLHVSTSTCSHPAVGDLTNPMAVDSLTSHALNTADASRRSVTVPVSSVRVAGAATEVLVEVLEGNSTLYSKRHPLSALGSLNVVFPDSTPSSQDSAYVDQCS